MDKNFKQNHMLKKTWLLDLDGTTVIHNSHLSNFQKFTPGAREFLLNIPVEDTVIFLTARDFSFKDITERFLIENGIRFHQVVYNLPHGARLLFNDKKPSGYKTAYAFNLCRDVGFDDGLIADVADCG